MSKQKRREALHRAMTPGGYGLTPEETKFLDLYAAGWQDRLAAGRPPSFVICATLDFHGNTYEYKCEMIERLGKKMDIHVVRLEKGDEKH